jgi:hypothetical protein
MKISEEYTKDHAAADSVHLRDAKKGGHLYKLANTMINARVKYPALKDHSYYEFNGAHEGGVLGAKGHGLFISADKKLFGHSYTVHSDHGELNKLGGKFKKYSDAEDAFRTILRDHHSKL